VLLIELAAVLVEGRRAEPRCRAVR